MSKSRFSQRLLALALSSLVCLAAARVCLADLTDDDISGLKHRMVDLVNQDRAKLGLKPVEYDPLASHIGDMFCREALKEGVAGHYLLDGYSPFHRYSLWGKSPHYNVENACATIASGGLQWTKESIWDAMVRYEQTMLAEKPPNDGHRRAIVDPWRTHLGIGIAYGEKGLRVAQEFLSKYMSIYKIPQEAKLGEGIPFAGRVLEPDKYQVAGVWSFYDPPPTPITEEEANTRLRYSHPKVHLELRPILPPDTYYSDNKTRGEVAVTEEGEFGVKVPQFVNKPGIYGLMVWLHPKGDKSKLFPATYFCIEVKE